MLERRLPLVAPMCDVPHIAGQETAIGTRQGPPPRRIFSYDALFRAEIELLTTPTGPFLKIEAVITKT